MSGPDPAWSRLQIWEPSLGAVRYPVQRRVGCGGLWLAARRSGEDDTRRVVIVIALLGLSLTLGFGRGSTASQATPPSAGSGATPATCPATTDAASIAIARVWHEEVINRRNPAALREILDPQVVHHAAGGFPDVMTEDAVAAMMSSFLTAFPDLHYTFDLFIVQDDFVVERYTATGTQDGPLQDLPPSGRTATWTGINIFRIECGKIVEVWSEVDALSRNQQLSGATAATPAP